MTGNSYTVFNAMIDIVASPGKALEEVKQHTSWLWWPLLITILAATGLMVYYYNWVDFQWLVEETIRSLPAEDRAESAEAIRTLMKPQVSLWTTVIVIVLVSIIIYVIQAVYLHLVNKLTTGTDIGFGKWFSIAVWTSFVGVFGTLAAFVLIIMSDNNHVSTQDLQVLSINSLLMHVPAGDPWFTWASSMSLINFWTIFLTSIGFARWTGTSMMKSTIIAAAPWVLIFGIWALTI